MLSPNLLTTRTHAPPAHCGCMPVWMFVSIRTPLTLAMAYRFFQPSPLLREPSARLHACEQAQSTWKHVSNQISSCRGVEGDSIQLQQRRQSGEFTVVPLH
jgi:hypothetical protein